MPTGGTLAQLDSSDDESTSEESSLEEVELLLLLLLFPLLLVSTEDSTTSLRADFPWSGCSVATSFSCCTAVMNADGTTAATLSLTGSTCSATKTALIGGRGLAAFKTLLSNVSAPFSFLHALEETLVPRKAVQRNYQQWLETTVLQGCRLSSSSRTASEGTSVLQRAVHNDHWRTATNIFFATRFPLSAEWEWVCQPICSGGLEVKKGGSPWGILLMSYKKEIGSRKRG